MVYNDDDIFGSVKLDTNVNPVSKYQDDDIFGSVQFAPVQQSQPQQVNPISNQKKSSGGLLNSPIGGFIRGLADIPEGGAQLLVNALPEGVVNKVNELNNMIPGMAKLSTTQGTKSFNELVRQNEDRYKKDWRQGDDVGLDVGRIGGNIAGIWALPIGAPETLLQSAKVGGLTGLIMPTTDEDFWAAKAGQAAVGAGAGAAGQLIGNAAGRLLKPITSTPTAGQQSGIDAAERLGIQLTPGQRTGSLGMQQVEATLARTPGSAGMIQRNMLANQEAMNRAAGADIGIPNATALTEDVLSEARKKIGSQFNNLSEKTILSLGDDFLGTVAKIDEANQALGSFASPAIKENVEKALDLASKGTLDGREYKVIRSTLNARADDAFKSGNSELGNALKQLTGSLDSAAREGLPEDMRFAWDLARKQYANLKTLEKGQVVEAGNVVPSRVASALRQFNPAAYKEGNINSNLMDIARTADAFKQTVPNSGTAERSMMQNMLFGNPLTGLPIVASSRAMQYAIESPLGRLYLERGGMLPVNPNTVGAMGGLLGGALGAQNQR
jgi:hypothetical protein